MKVKVGFKVGDKVTYKGITEHIPAVITAIREPNPELMQFAAEYTIKVTTNRARTYRKGDTFPTSGNWLNKR